MGLLKYISDFFKNILYKLKGNQNPAQEEFEEEITEETLAKLEKEQKEEVFKFSNMIFDKLNYLEQYIKIFSLNYPRQYNEYVSIIQREREDYEKELAEYKKGLDGNITFAIDPERETRRRATLIRLEADIKKFVENEVNYNLYKTKFSKLCKKLNLFYNVLVETETDVNTISKQINNACELLGKTVDEVKEQIFFENDSRKREEILNYILYSEYIIFKSYLRCSLVEDFAQYKEVSVCHSFFADEDYNRLIFKFLIEELENLQNFITNNLQNQMTYKYILENCQKLQDELNEYDNVFQNNEYFTKVIKFENTISNMVNTSNVNFDICLPSALEIYDEEKEIISVNKIAITMLDLIDNEVALLLKGIINNFGHEISWREFYFLCKIFELDKLVIKEAESTIFNIIKDKFLDIQEKYNEYTDSYIREEKMKILNYNGSKKKKYILLLTSDAEDLVVISGILERLFLDFVIEHDRVYLNHSYFNGFKNLEENFGTCKTM